MRVRPARPQQIAIGVALAVIGADAGTKLLAVRLLSGRGFVRAGAGFGFELYRNHIGAGNTFGGRPVLASLLALAAVIVLAFGVSRVRRVSSGVAVGLLLGGGVGNLLDRVFGAPGPFRGGVIDWLRTPRSSGSMNLADIAINCGVLALLIAAGLSWRADRRTRADVAAQAGAEEGETAAQA